jgi:Transposase DDE domain
VVSERHGIPVGWDIDGANRNDVAVLEPTLTAIAADGLLTEIGTLHLDRGYDSGAVRTGLRDHGVDQFEIQRRGTKVPGVKRQPLRLGLRWIVEATNTRWSNYGQLRRNTDRRARHRHAALCLATVILIIGRLIDWRPRRGGEGNRRRRRRNRWSPA